MSLKVAEPALGQDYRVTVKGPIQIEGKVLRKGDVIWLSDQAALLWRDQVSAIAKPGGDAEEKRAKKSAPKVQSKA
jgi:hypothetical protein